MLMTKLADNGVFHLFDCLRILGTVIFIKEGPKEEVQRADVGGEKNTLQHASPADMGGDGNGSSAIAK